MNKLYTAFLDLVRRINDDALKVFDDVLTYILRYLSIDDAGTVWTHDEKDNQAFADFMSTYFAYQQEQLATKFWYDAWGDMFMELSGKFKSFRGQFFTPAAVADLCAKMSVPRYQGDRPIVNDCACGSARMLLAAEQLAFEKGSAQPYLIGEDIDGMCCKMAAINMAVHGCLGEVIRHDSLQHPDELSYGYIINETLTAGLSFPSIRRSEVRSDFKKLQL